MGVLAALRIAGVASRFFRFWAIADEMVPPENMPQCITMTTTISDFWRGWHSSYNKWLVRYIYIPLGGSLRGRGKGGKGGSEGGSEGGGGGGENRSGLPTLMPARCGELYITARKLLNTAIVGVGLGDRPWASGC